MEQLDKRLRDLAELQFLSESLESVDEFTSFYEKMLARALVAGDQTMARAMKKILARQMYFLITERAKAVNNNEDTANVQ